jgi:hypothetical protein
MQWSTVLGSKGRHAPAQGTPGSAFILIVGYPTPDGFDLNQRSRVVGRAPWVAEFGRAANDKIFS